MIFRGGCLCGACRYEFDDEAADVAHCHCSMCRRATGGIVTTWITVPRRAFRWSRGEPRRYRSSAHAQRRFCPECGAQLLFSDDRADNVDVTVATLDHPEALVPARHIWYQNRVPWLRLDEHLAAEMQESDPLGPRS